MFIDFRRATFALACGTVEKVEQEILRSLVVANKNLVSSLKFIGW